MKKTYVPLFDTADFVDSLENRVQAELYAIIGMLEADGKLISPFGEKVESKLFALRVIQTANVRVFYTYGINDEVFGILAYHKKSRKIPLQKIKLAKKRLKVLIQEGLVK